MLKRWGKDLVDRGHISGKALDKMDLPKYIAKIRADTTAKKVYVVEEKGWSEWFLTNWFKDNYEQLRFTKIWDEGTQEYNELKKKMNFYGRPDFLGERQGNVLKIELECFSSLYKFMHQKGYADVVLCYSIDEIIPDIELYDLKGILGYQDIINTLELADYLYLTDTEFRVEMDDLIMDEIDELTKKWVH